jgi:hypothetical protein
MTKTRRVTVQVTQEHIDKGERHICARCPAALAMSDAGLEAGVYSDFLYLADSGESVAMPWDVARFIKKFDLGWPVEPFTFDIDIPEDAFPQS